MKALALALLMAAPAAAEISWTVAGDTAALVGQEARVVYRPTTAPGAKLEPDALASATTGFAVVKAEAAKDGSWVWTVLPLDEGKLSFVARWKLDGRPAAAPSVVLAVKTPAVPKDADIEDIKAPIAARRAWWPWLLAAALGAAAWEAWRRWKARPAAAAPEAPPAPPLPPEDAAENALDDLLASGVWEKGEHAAFYLRLTEILRMYLEARYGEPATAMTSVEVARLIKSREAGLEASASARDLLQRADLVKFARITPAPDEGPRDVETARRVIGATTPPKTPAAPAAAGGAR